MLGSDAQTDDVQSVATPRHGDLHPVDETHAVLRASRARLVQPIHIVMVGQRQYTYAFFSRMIHDFSRRQDPI